MPIQIIVKKSVRTSKRTPHFTITKINWLTLFKEITAVHNENHTESINTKYKVTEKPGGTYIYRSALKG
jgi:hypothetical protein